MCVCVKSQHAAIIHTVTWNQSHMVTSRDFRLLTNHDSGSITNHIGIWIAYKKKINLGRLQKCMFWSLTKSNISWRLQTGFLGRLQNPISVDAYRLDFWVACKKINIGTRLQSWQLFFLCIYHRSLQKLGFKVNTDIKVSLILKRNIIHNYILITATYYKLQ